jgi:hypothetical protein
LRAPPTLRFQFRFRQHFVHGVAAQRSGVALAVLRIPDDAPCHAIKDSPERRGLPRRFAMF